MTPSFYALLSTAFSLATSVVRNAAVICRQENQHVIKEHVFVWFAMMAAACQVLLYAVLTFLLAAMYPVHRTESIVRRCSRALRVSLIKYQLPMSSLSVQHQRRIGIRARYQRLAVADGFVNHLERRMDDIDRVNALDMTNSNRGLLSEMMRDMEERLEKYERQVANGLANDVAPTNEHDGAGVDVADSEHAEIAQSNGARVREVVTAASNHVQQLVSNVVGELAAPPVHLTGESLLVKELAVEIDKTKSKIKITEDAPYI